MQNGGEIMNETQEYVNACIDALKYGFTQPISLLVNKKMSAEQKDSVIQSLSEFSNNLSQDK